MNPRFKEILIGAAIVLTTLASWWFFFALRENQQLEIRSARGEVIINGQPATVGMKFDANGAAVTTGADGFVNLVLSDGSTSQLSQGSKFRVLSAHQDMRGKHFRSAFQLDAGEIIREVPKTVDVKRESNLVTRNANIGVRGTLYVVNGEAGGTAIMVHRGAVSAQGQAGEEASLPENYGTRVAPNAAPETASVLPAPPVLAEPAHGVRLAAAKIRFAWEAVADARSYLLEIAKDERFNDFLVRRIVESASLELDNLPEDGRFYWRVKSVDGRKLQGRGSEARILHYKFHHESGRAMIRQGNAKEALASLRLAEKGFPNEAAVQSDLGWAHYINGALDSAIPHLDRAVAADKTDLEALQRRGRVNYWLKKYDAARKDYEAVLAAAKDDADAKWGLAEVEIRENKLDAAYTRLNEVLSLNPQHVYAAMSGAKAAFEQGDIARARAFLVTELRARPNNVEALRLQDAMLSEVKR